MANVKKYEQPITVNGVNVGKITILVGGLNEPNPKEFMDEAVSKYVGSKGHNQFVEIHLDNPWTRVVMDCINEVPLTDLLETDRL